MKILHLDSNHPLLLKMLKEAGFLNEENYKASKSEIEEIISNYNGIVIRSRLNIDKHF
jgi:D-3-phosphoglycerate dehydrogenase